LEIRTAGPEDCAGIARLQVESYQESYRGIFPARYLEGFTVDEQEQDWQDFLSYNSNHVLLVAVGDDGQISGYSLALPGSDGYPPYESELVTLHVRRGNQRQGLGRRLVSASSQTLNEQGVRSLFLWVLKENPACAFYEKLGGVYLAEKPWQNKKYFGAHIFEVAYCWRDIRTLME
jgi:ribosomal protein S18 acetylase RimI-like enzyme